MFTTAIIAFREFLEAFLIVGVFFGISQKMKLKRGLEISLAASIGMVISLCLAAATYFLGDHAKTIFTEKNADILGSYLLIFSGVFIAYVVFSLHSVLNRERGATILSAHKKLQQQAFDMSLFATIMFLVIREGFEVSLFTATSSLFSLFLQNVLGLLLGFTIASVVGLATFFAYIRFHIGKVFKATEYAIILLGASMVQNGITKLLAIHFNFSLSNIVSLHFYFLPNEETLIGHLLQGFFGIDRGFSLLRLGIMLVYVALLYHLFLRKRFVKALSKKQPKKKE